MNNNQIQKLAINFQIKLTNWKLLLDFEESFGWLLVIFWRLLVKGKYLRSLFSVNFWSIFLTILHNFS